MKVHQTVQKLDSLLRDLEKAETDVCYWNNKLEQIKRNIKIAEADLLTSNDEVANGKNKETRQGIMDKLLHPLHNEKIDYKNQLNKAKATRDQLVRKLDVSILASKLLLSSRLSDLHLDTFDDLLS